MKIRVVKLLMTPIDFFLINRPTIYISLLNNNKLILDFEYYRPNNIEWVYEDNIFTIKDYTFNIYEEGNPNANMKTVITISKNDDTYFTNYDLEYLLSLIEVIIEERGISITSLNSYLHLYRNTFINTIPYKSWSKSSNITNH